jgi:hypothetical protein
MSVEAPTSPSPIAAEALLSPSETALAILRQHLAETSEAVDLPALLVSRNWREQVLGAAITLLRGSDDAVVDALWRGIDGISWVAPQLIAVAFLVDDKFAATAEPRLFDQARRPPKMVGALVHAYHRLPSPSLPTVAQLGRHERVMTTEEARIGVRVVDWWLDQLPQWCAPDERTRWRRQPRQPISRSS